MSFVPSDLIYFFQWWLTIELLGLLAWPLAKHFFKDFLDEGWGLSKILGILLTSYLAWLLASLKLLPFSQTSVLLVAAVLAVAIWLRLPRLPRSPRLVVVEEVLFLAALAFWAWIRGFSPDIHGLEKYMDYGFLLSILRSRSFPPLDHFLAGSTINYYYFGHLMAAVLTKLSMVPASAAYNLQIANLYALTFMGGFSLGSTLISKLLPKIKLAIFGGLLTALFLTSIGNLHAVLEYLLGRGANYWYPTATRLIPFTIDEFPLYSFIVADLHGHVSDLPIVLLAVGLLISIANWSNLAPRSLGEGGLTNWSGLILLAFAIGAMYATNSWDFAIYLLATGAFLFLKNLGIFQQTTDNREQITDNKKQITNNSEAMKPASPAGGQYNNDRWSAIKRTAEECLVVVFFAIIFYLPYWLTVRPLSQGLGLVRGFSPINLVLILWGFFFFIVLSFLLWIFGGRIRRTLRLESVVKLIARITNVKIEIQNPQQYNNVTMKQLVLPDKVALVLMGLGLLMIIIPEIVYLKDIYIPDYYRANTMFKFYYQAWVFLAIACGYAVIRLILWIQQNKNFWGAVFNLLFLFMISGVFFYSYVALNSSTGNFGQNKSLDGTKYLETLYPDDAKVISWLNQNIKGQPIILEAVGDSYTDYARVSANTGLPTVLGWPVHEWLWRGSYDEAGKRTSLAKDIYETNDPRKAKSLLNQFKVKYIIVGTLEREKYPNLNEQKFSELGKIVFQSNQSKVYQIY